MAFAFTKSGPDAAVGSSPRGLAVADFNGDGIVDVATANFDSNTVSVLLGRGDGTLGAASSIGVGKQADSVAAADLNGDGFIDLVTSNYGASTATILLGNGNGTFAAGKTVAIGPNAYSVVIADVTGDGKLDILATNTGDFTLSLLAGNGDGTFKSAVSINRGSVPAALAIGDFNHDGRQDIVTTDYTDNTVSVLFGRTDGSFSSGIPITVGTRPVALATADLNGDGNLDIVVGNETSGTVSVILGKGDGTFQTPTTLTVGGNPEGVAIGDVDRDGHLDIVTANTADGTVSVLLGKGNGTFGAQTTVAAGSGAWALALADLNGDGGLDIAVANQKAGTVSTLLGSGYVTPPDLTITTAFLGQTTVAAGSGVDVSYQIKNVGSLGAGASTSQIYISTDATISIGDRVIGSVSDPSIAGGTALSGTQTVVIPSEYVAGKYYIGVIADGTNQVAEGNENNNTSAALPITITSAPGPDLTIGGFQINNTMLTTGGNTYVAYSVNNSGTVAAGPSTTKIYLTADNAITSDDVVLLATSETALGVNGSTSYTYPNLTLVIPDSVAPGTYFIAAVADADHVVSEGYEHNNASNALAVTITKGVPDLAFFTGKNDVAVAQATVAAGGGDSLSYYVVNNGTGTAFASHTGVYLSTDATITTADTLLATQNTPTIAVYQSGQNYDYETAGFTIPSSLAPGTYYLGAITDRDGLIAESNEANNISAAVQITVTAAVPPPTVSINPVAGDNVVNRAEALAGLTVTGSTTNVGDGQTVTVVLKTTGGAIVGQQTAIVSGNAYKVTLDGSALGDGHADGAYVITADVSNASGAAPEASRAISVDATAPVLGLYGLTLVAQSGADQATIAGSVERIAGTTVHILDGATDLGAATLDGAGNWSFSATLSGQHKLHAVATDVAGNTSVGAETAGFNGDTASFAFALDTATVRDQSGSSSIYGPDGTYTVLSGFGHDVFSDGADLGHRSAFGTVSHDTHGFGGEVYALYDGLLGRAPDAVGLEHWAAQFAAGVSPTVLADAFLSSPEGQQRSGAADNGAFLTQLYQATLHRAPDQAGYDHWLAELAAGTTRGTVGAGFALSPEHLGSIQPALDAGLFVGDEITSAVARIYYAVLARAPDAAGLAYWSGTVHAGTSLTEQTAAFLQAPEVQGRTGGLTTAEFVDFVYVNALGRHAEQTGLDAWVDRIDHGGSRVDVTTAIGQSAEAQGHLLPLIEQGWHLT